MRSALGVRHPARSQGPNSPLARWLAWPRRGRWRLPTRRSLTPAAVARALRHEPVTERGQERDAAVAEVSAAREGRWAPRCRLGPPRAAAESGPGQRGSTGGAEARRLGEMPQTPAGPLSMIYHFGSSSIAARPSSPGQPPRLVPTCISCPLLSPVHSFHFSRDPAASFSRSAHPPPRPLPPPSRKLQASVPSHRDFLCPGRSGGLWHPGQCRMPGAGFSDPASSERGVGGEDGHGCLGPEHGLEAQGLLEFSYGRWELDLRIRFWDSNNCLGQF